MAKQFRMVKVAIEIHEDDWNNDLQVVIMNKDKVVGEYTSCRDLEIIEVPDCLITDIKEEE